MLEKNIQRNILNYLNGLPECVAENVHGDAYSSGRPDINACWNGLLFRIEVKTPDHGNTATVVQKENLRRWGAAGAVAVVVYSVDEVKWLVSESGVRCFMGTNECRYCPMRHRGDCYKKRKAV